LRGEAFVPGARVGTSSGLPPSTLHLHVFLWVLLLHSGRCPHPSPTPNCRPRHRLPPKRVLTLNLEVPEAWLVEATKSVYDLDNLRLVRHDRALQARGLVE
jgi:hypothetical protein